MDKDINYYGYDFDETAIILAKANLLITMNDLQEENPNLTSRLSMIFSEIFQVKNQSIIGSLEYNIPYKYDLIMTNPLYIKRLKII